MIKIMVREIIKTDTGHIVEIGEYCSLTEYNMDRIVDRPRYNQNYRGNLEEEILEGISEQIRITEVKIIEVDIEEIIKNDNYERGRSSSRDREYSNNSNRRNKRSNSRSRSGLTASVNRGRIRCYKCREYDHFAKDCLTSKQMESGQIQ